MKTIHPLLELAEVLRARHDFLSRVTALVEAHAADELEVEHLCNEFLLGRLGDQREAVANHEP